MKIFTTFFIYFANFCAILCMLTDDYVKDQLVQLNKKINSYCVPKDDTNYGQIYIKYTSNEIGLSKNEENLVIETIKNIQSENFADSVLGFSKILKNDRFIKRIVSKIYSNNPNDTKIILKFVDVVPEIYKRYLFLWSVYENLAIRKDFRQRVVLLTGMRAIKSSQQYDSFSDFDKQNLRVMINMLDILDGRTKSTESNLKEECKIGENPPIDEKLELLVDLSRNIEETLTDFVELRETAIIERMKLDEWNSQLVEYNMDYESKFPDMLKLGYKLKSLQEHGMADENKFSAKIMQKSFLYTVQGIVWDQVCIRNTLPVTFPYYKSFLIADENVKADNGIVGDQEIFVLNNGGQVPIFGAEWIFESLDDGVSFYIKNVQTQKYLGASDKFYGPKTGMRMPIMTKNKENSTEYHWKVESEYVLYNHYHIINVKYNEELIHSNYFYINDKNYLHIGEAGKPWLVEKC